MPLGQSTQQRISSSTICVQLRFLLRPWHRSLERRLCWKQLLQPRSIFSYKLQNETKCRTRRLFKVPYHPASSSTSHHLETDFLKVERPRKKPSCQSNKGHKNNHLRDPSPNRNFTFPHWSHRFHFYQYLKYISAIIAPTSDIFYRFSLLTGLISHHIPGFSSFGSLYGPMLSRWSETTLASTRWNMRFTWW